MRDGVVSNWATGDGDLERMVDERALSDDFLERGLKAFLVFLKSRRTRGPFGSGEGVVEDMPVEWIGPK